MTPSGETDSLPARVFSRLPPNVRAGDVVRLHRVPGEWRVETAKLAADLKDTKCSLVRVSDLDKGNSDET